MPAGTDAGVLYDAILAAGYDQLHGPGVTVHGVPPLNQIEVTVTEDPDE